VKKKSDRNRWVMHVPVLSTSHIKQETLNNLGPEFQVLNMKEGICLDRHRGVCQCQDARRTETGN